MRIPLPLLRFRLPVWRLRTGLLVPIFLVVPLFLAVTGVLWEGVARQEADSLVAQRQQTALAGLVAQVNERRHANETIVYLLSKRDGLGGFIETTNTARLAQTLIVMQASLDLSYISVFAPNGQRLLQVGAASSTGLDGRLAAASILGRDESGVGADDTGLLVAAAALVPGTTATAGVLVVGSYASARSLASPGTSHEVAVFERGRLVDSSVQREDLLAALRTTVVLNQADVEGLNQTMAHYTCA